MQGVERRLYEYAELKHREESLKKQWDLVLEEKESRIERTSRPFREYIPNPNKTTDPTFDIVCDIMRLYDCKINSVIAQLETVQGRIAEIEFAFTDAALTAEEMTFVRLRYIERRDMVSVAEQMAYSERHVRRIKRRIIAKLQDVRFMSA